MMNQILRLSDLQIGQKALIKKIEINGLNRRRFFDLGFIAGTEVSVAFVSPLADPIAYNIRGTVIALRNEEAHKINIELISDVKT
jgi:Fe2+ transport system protein FeoA